MHTITIGDPSRNTYTQFLHDRISRADRVTAVDAVTLRAYTSRDGNTFVLEITGPNERITEGCRVAAQDQGLVGRIVFLLPDSQGQLQPQTYLK